MRMQHTLWRFQWNAWSEVFQENTLVVVLVPRCNWLIISILCSS